MAFVGSDGYLYPATLLGFPLEEFYDGTKSLKEVIDHFYTTARAPLIIPLFLFRVFLFVWIYSLILISNASRRKIAIVESYLYKGVVAAAFWSVLLGALWYYLEPSIESEILFVAGASIFAYMWLTGVGYHKKRRISVA